MNMPATMAARKITGSRRPKARAPTAGPGHNPTSPQPTPNTSGAADEPGVDRAMRGNFEHAGEPRRRRLQDEPKSGCGDRQRPDHDDEEGRVPTAGNIQEAEDLFRVDHLRDGKPEPEYDAGGERGELIGHDYVPAT